MAVSRNLKAIYNKIFETPELFAANTIQRIKQTMVIRKRVRGIPPLTKEQKRQVKKYWKPYTKISTNWARFNTFKTGVFDPEGRRKIYYFPKHEQIYYQKNQKARACFYPRSVNPN